ncbi:sulfatase family protein [Runella limosa]|uniref:sulfatase family protein n=1 Tax=Runella limosa TaxID=370978 RepID=UPI000419D736|nr:sulfatase [Runella limosa]
MKKTALIVIAFGLTLGMGLLSFKPKDKRPNILILFSDDHALQAISAYGSPYIKTPNIDRLAKEGAVYQNMFCTNSLCAPSRATLLTGKYSHKNGHRDNLTKFDASQPMYPKYLQAAGYQMGWIGKWHLEATPQYFDYWSVLPGQGAYYNPDFIEMGGKTVRQEGYATDVITEKALHWLDQDRDPSKPFCLVIGHKCPHRNWQPDTTDLRAFDHVKFPLPKSFYDSYEGRIAAKRQDMTVTKTMRLKEDLKVDAGSDPFVKRMNPAQRKAWLAYYDQVSADFKKQNLSGRALDEWKYQRYMQDYLGTLLSLDRNVGKVLDYLDKKGLTENTLVVYSSDQGFYLGEHGWFDKRFMYEESHHMPMLIRYPKRIKAGTIDRAIHNNTDFAPTILQEAGLSVPADMQGQSFFSKKARKSTYYHYYEYPAEHSVQTHFGIRTDRYKLIRFYKDGEFWELYDLQKDPEEMNNLYDKPAYQKIQKQLTIDLKQLIRQYDDTEAAAILAKEEKK